MLRLNFWIDYCSESDDVHKNFLAKANRPRSKHGYVILRSYLFNKETSVVILQIWKGRYYDLIYLLKT